jgi:DNA (cytosine-5)-methyltransferase 1
MRYFSTFSGAGGFEIGMPQHFKCVGFSEVDKYASAVLRYHWPDVPNYGDITKIDWSAVPDFDLLVGGSPCQDLSVAGKQKGLTGERSGLFYEYVKALEIKKPAHFIWENVKGALSSNGGRDFAAILSAFSEAGYSLLWQVLNAKDFGVPQNRERVFVVGTRSDFRSPREVFFESGYGSQSDGKVLPTIRATHYKSGDNQPVVRCPLRFLDRNQKNIEGDYAFTVDAGQTAGVTDGVRVRRLMPIECERLMSWPDDWTRWGKCGESCEDDHEMSDTQRYKMCGNGVVSEVVKKVIELL